MQHLFVLHLKYTKVQALLLAAEDIALNFWCLVYVGFPLIVY